MTSVVHKGSRYICGVFIRFEVVLDHDALEYQVGKAMNNKDQTSRDGALTVKIVEGRLP